MIQTNVNTRPSSLLGGTMIIAGTSIGAGMFSMPTVSSGMWFFWSVVCLLTTWFCMYHSALLILETNLKYPVGSSFNTFVKDILGKKWNVFNNLVVVFVLYIITYAYISGGGSMVNLSLNSLINITLPDKVSGLFFALVLSSIVWFSATLVSRLTSILFGGMLITFFISMGDLTTSLKVSTLFNLGETDTSYFPYVFVALPFFVATFGFHGNVSSLVKIYGKEPTKIRKCLLYGSLLSLFIYLLWQIGTLGNITREEFKPIIAEGGNISVLVSTLVDSVDSELIERLLNFFASFAVVSSFLGITLGLFDFIADAFKFDDTGLGRFKTSLIVFVPPTIGGVFFPEGFLYAIGYAGMAGATWGIIIPALAAKKSREQDNSAGHGVSGYKVWGGNILLYVILVFGILVVITHSLGMLNLLPRYA